MCRGMRRLPPAVVAVGRRQTHPRRDPPVAAGRVLRKIRGMDTHRPPPPNTPGHAVYARRGQLRRVRTAAQCARHIPPAFPARARRNRALLLSPLLPAVGNMDNSGSAPPPLDDGKIHNRPQRRPHRLTRRLTLPARVPNATRTPPSRGRRLFMPTESMILEFSPERDSLRPFFASLKFVL